MSPDIYQHFTIIGFGSRTSSAEPRTCNKCKQTFWPARDSCLLVHMANTWPQIIL